MNAVKNDVPRFELLARYTALGAGIGVLLGIPDLVLGGRVHVMIAGALALGAVGFLLARAEIHRLRQAVWDPLTGAANGAFFVLATSYEQGRTGSYTMSLQRCSP